MVNNPFSKDGIISCQYCGSGKYLYNKDGIQNGYCGNCGAWLEWPEVDLTGWNNPEINLPLPRSNIVVRYSDEEVECWYSSIGKWMAPDSIVSWRTPDAWRYMTEDEKNGA